MRFYFYAFVALAAIAKPVISAPSHHDGELSDLEVGPSLLIPSGSVPSSGLIVKCLPVDEPPAGRHTSDPEEECFHGRTAPTWNEDEPWNGGSIGCNYYPNGPEPKTEKYELIPGDQGAAIQNVTISAEFESMQPLQIKMTVNNTTPLPITFWKEWSPVSKRGWELGYFSIESEIWGQFFGRVGQKYRMATLTDIPKRPENSEELVQLNPGESISEVVEIPHCVPKQGSDLCKPYMWERWTEMLRLAGIKRIFIQGDWYGIWAQPKEEVMETLVDEPMLGYWTRWWANNVLLPTPEQLKEFGTYLPFNKPWYETEAALVGNFTAV
ncbi:hypothetical protein FPSE_07477 [Fusarium pseudograminearum CS3096]|uniref:Uncharacterized protein n=1 Tax=Fusarium pseudograminearum (strain CS3096) TaxID=1028729 RepID=K3VE20_FUSPC|nr:hypothetical protein FPSE_07477 [Fusarium pseudograminearum CS3096]EKJ72357.1 hypothetical protein FPSE_07477 [Fusarium pseudograminearum CS3096]